MRVPPFPGGYSTHGLDIPSTPVISLPLVALVVASLVSGALVAFVAHRWPRIDLDPEPSEPVSRWARRLDPEAATGLALTLALAALVLGGIVLGVLALVLRGNPDAIGLDASAAKWGHAHGTALTNDVLDALTHLGQPGTIVALAVVLAVVETARTRSPWIAPFLLVVVAGNGIITTTIKHVADRVRPEFNPVAETLGPSFPSGHSSWSAAFFAAAALVLARHGGRRAREVLAGAAAGIAVAIAATRVLLDVHWLSDVVAGLALGWAWFAACAIAFGGRLLRFGATAEAARDRVPETASRTPVSAGGR
jgi:membrane-associated phospholipid phosphatase